MDSAGGGRGREQIGKLGLFGFRNIQVARESNKGLQNHKGNRATDFSFSSKRNVAPKETSKS